MSVTAWNIDYRSAPCSSGLLASRGKIEGPIILQSEEIS